MAETTPAVTAAHRRAIQAPPGYGFPHDAASMLSWPDVVSAIAGARTYWLGTTMPDGRPYATPLWAVWLDGALYFDGMPSTRWARNLAADPRLNIHLEVNGLAVILDGVVEDLETDATLGARIVMTWKDKYRSGMPDPTNRGVFRLWPVTARAWTESMRDGAAWHLDGGAAG